MCALLTVGLCWNAVVLSQETNRIDPIKKGTNMIPIFLIEDDLRESAAKLGCHLTLEYQGLGIGDGGGTKVAEPQHDQFNADSVASFLSKLRAYLDAFIIERDVKNPKILHIIQKVLADDKDYALNQKISVEYSGRIVPTNVPIIPRPASAPWFRTEGGLIPAVAEKIKEDIREGTEDNNIPGMVGDASTRVNVHATNETVRSIFTDCLSITNYNAILWRAVATTATVGDTNCVLVQFFGPKK